MVGVYKITNLYTGDCYIGQSIHVEERWAEHFCKSYGAMHNPKFQKDIEALGKGGFSFEILEECQPEALVERETYWIDRLKPTYNTVVVGHPVSENTRKKISKALVGRKQPEELVEKRKAAIRERHKTHPQTNAGHRKRIGVRREDGEIREFESVKATAEYFGMHASEVTRALKQGWRIRKAKVWYVV